MSPMYRTRRFTGLSYVRLLAAALVATCGAALLDAQIPGRNVNMVSGRTLPGGDPYLQRQNEPSVAASTRNPLHLLAGANDYRTVDLPGLPNSNETGDAWMGVFKSYDGGNTWRSSLIPGFPQDNVGPGSASPLRAYKAGRGPRRPRRHQRALLLHRHRLRPLLAVEERDVRVAVHRQQQPGGGRSDHLPRYEADRHQRRVRVHRQAVVRGRHPARQRADLHDHDIAEEPDRGRIPTA